MLESDSHAQGSETRRQTLGTFADVFVQNVYNARVNEYLNRLAVFRVRINGTFGL